MASLGVLTLTLHIPGCASLKEKRGRLKPLLARLHKNYNVSAAEIDYLDVHQNSVISVALVSNDPKHTRRVLQKIVDWIDTGWPDVDLVDDTIELL